MKILANDGISQSGIDDLTAAGFEVLNDHCSTRTIRKFHQRRKHRSTSSYEVQPL